MGGEQRQPIDETIHGLYRLKKYRRYYKYIAIIFVILTLCFVFLWSYIIEVGPSFFLSQNLKKGRLEIGKIDLKKKFVEYPKFVGGGDRPFTLMADRAQQVGEKKVILENVQARITLKDGSILSILAKGGDVQIVDQKNATLYGDVNIIHEKGDTELWTDSVFIDMDQGFLDTQCLVEGTSLYGALRGSQGIYIHQGTQLYKLKGPSDVMINKLEKGKE